MSALLATFGGIDGLVVEGVVVIALIMILALVSNRVR